MVRDHIVGRTLRWTFEDGPMRGKTFEHEFGRDGKVTWGMADAGNNDTSKPRPSAKYELEAIGESVCAVSYLSDSGYTLTVVLDEQSARLVAFASNEKSISVQHGTFERVGEQKRPPRAAAKAAPHTA